jgi:hypothetical protein
MREKSGQQTTNMKKQKSITMKEHSTQTTHLVEICIVNVPCDGLGHFVKLVPDLLIARLHCRHTAKYHQTKRYKAVTWAVQASSDGRPTLDPTSSASPPSAAWPPPPAAFAGEQAWDQGRYPRHRDELQHNNSTEYNRADTDEHLTCLSMFPGSCSAKLLQCFELPSLWAPTKDVKLDVKQHHS